MNEAFLLARLRLALTQAGLGGKVGLAQWEISRIEKGWIPPAKARAKLARTLGVTETDLWVALKGDLASERHA